MQGSVFDKPAFRPLPLLFCLLLAGGIFVSWAYLDDSRDWWNAIDLSVFRTLNESLRGVLWWQTVWAVANSHFFDFLSSLLMTFLAFRYAIAEDRRYLNERIAVILTIALTIAVAVIGNDKLLIHEKRWSASAGLSDVVRLSEQVTWLQTRDISYNSFPSDHATVLLMVCIMLWYFAGRRTGLVMLAATVFFCFPRLIGGAHWFSDMAAGALPLALVATSLMIFTPLYRYVVRGFQWLADRPFCTACINAAMNREAPTLLAKGCCMGAADIVPGVSGGTVAYILGIWYRLIEAIRSFDLAWLKLVLRLRWTEAVQTAHFGFVVPLVIGIGIAMLTFTKFIPLPLLIISHPEPIYGLFFGLIAGSIVHLLQETGLRSGRDALTLAVGTGIGWLLVNVVPVDTPETAWFVFLCGCIAISAMLLPGISGSFILLILGKYAYILGAVGRLDFTVILPFMLGCLTGLVTFSRGASWLLHHHYRMSVLAITGILIGSLWMIWPFQNRVYAVVREKERLISSSPVWPEHVTAGGWAGLGLMVVGFALVMGLGVLASRRKDLQTPPIADNAQLG